MKLNNEYLQGQKIFLEAMLKKTEGGVAPNFSKEETSRLAKIIPGFDFQLEDVDQREKIVNAISAADLLLDSRLQERIKNIQNWEAVDNIAIDVLAERELEEYRKANSKSQITNSKTNSAQPTSPPSSSKP